MFGSSWDPIVTVGDGGVGTSTYYPDQYGNFYTGANMQPSGDFFSTISSLISGAGNLAVQGYNTLLGVNNAASQPTNAQLAAQRQQMLTYAMIGGGILIAILLLRR